jgi:hypothetical protein
MNGPRPRTRIGKARDFLRANGRPATVVEILVAIGEQPHSANRHIIACSLRDYVRKGKVFTKQGNTFGLVDFNEAQPPIQTIDREDRAIRGRARIRVWRSLIAGRGVMTPAGIICARPPVCQWCERQVEDDRRGHAGTEAYHYLGYGDTIRDLTVIFACRSCHRYFESGTYTTQMILKRFQLT